VRRRYAIGVDLSLILADASPEEERSVRALSYDINAFVVDCIDRFPWPVDMTFSTSVDRVTEEL
jgi:hypothetical protein